MVHAMQLLARLSVDDSILSSVFHQHLIQRCLATLVNALDPSLVDSIVSLESFLFISNISIPTIKAKVGD